MQILCLENSEGIFQGLGITNTTVKLPTLKLGLQEWVTPYITIKTKTKMKNTLTKLLQNKTKTFHTLVAINIFV